MGRMIQEGPLRVMFAEMLSVLCLFVKCLFCLLCLYLGIFLLLFLFLIQLTYLTMKWVGTVDWIRKRKGEVFFLCNICEYEMLICSLKLLTANTVNIIVHILLSINMGNMLLCIYLCRIYFQFLFCADYVGPDSVISFQISP